MNESTRILSPSDQATETGPPLVVRYPRSDGSHQVQEFKTAFEIGRESSCQVVIQDATVSRRHARFEYRNSQWWVQDLGSANGTWLDGQAIDQASLSGSSIVALGHAGPEIQLRVKSQPVLPEDSKPTATASSARYLDPDYEGPVGEHTAIIRQAIFKKNRRQSRIFWSVLGIVGVLFVIVAAIALFQYSKIQQLNDAAVNVFYTMKTLEMQVLDLQDDINADAREDLKAELQLKQQALADLQRQYAEFAAQINAASPRLSTEDELILKIARQFGECDLIVPDDFAAEVKRYIRKWQASDRLARAIRRLSDKGYTHTIVNALKAKGLPPEFIYLALQESNFRIDAVGPITRYGHAKGMWQFIPSTATSYGLKLGPLKDQGVYDPADQRHHFERATQAAATYLNYIYTTSAQASGLLVMASYNWGEGNVNKRLRTLPKNPRERNFWALLQQHKIPNETYDYVFHIFSAAVIGENPQLFGFNFSDPLGGYR